MNHRGQTHLLGLHHVREVDGGQGIAIFVLLVFILRRQRVASGHRHPVEPIVGRPGGSPASLWTGPLLWLAAVRLLLLFRGRGGGGGAVLSMVVPGVRQSAQKHPNRPG